MPFILHVCCADCLLRYLVASGYRLPASAQHLIRDYSSFPTAPTLSWKPHLYFTNPNIYPTSEYRARLAAVQQVASLLDLPLTIADYQPQDYFSLPTSQQQFSQSTPLTNRCRNCQLYRLQQTLSFLHIKFPHLHTFSTTMLARQYLDHQQIKHLGCQLATSSTTTFLIPQFLFSPAKLKTAGFFQQNYCGCFFSLADKTRAKYFHSPTVV